MSKVIYDSGSNVSFYHIQQQHHVAPKIFYDKNSLHGERNDNKIDYTPEKVNKIKNEQRIELETIDQEWRDGVQTNKDINTHPFSNFQKMNKFYANEPDLTTHLPLFVPSERILLNTPAGIHEQWKLYLSKTGQL